ncbi:MAG: type II secretion system minor pseudopilin GspI [Candidatus Sedimenticola endophacoides]
MRIDHMHARGFTLLEVLVALAILAIAMSAVIKVSSSNTDNTAYLEEKMLAHWVAMNRWSEIQLVPPDKPLYSTSGVELMAGRKWEWRREVTNSPDQDVKKIRLEVTADDNEAVLAKLTGYWAIAY